MPRTCTICAHPERAAIDKALVAGGPYRSIAKHFGASAQAVLRHKESHLRDLLAQAKQRQTAHEAALGTAVQEQEAATLNSASSERRDEVTGTEPENAGAGRMTMGPND